ncbi:sigma-70 family RNA polymerase sigma factor [Heliobacterium chlorum]|uniref:Sigma-70 family RNA polymerase sigma factor n=2 Tax=Heliobacterium chlorum TaxID=2698 RepID=A0ABR7T2F5_HELCL|nr:sigma-70 family RNA polymerase sigma factor [Heliobacterium chlorum]
MESGRRLVYHFAKLYAHERVTEDLLQCGYEGLLKAVHRYDPHREATFCTYASHCIIGEIRHHIRKEATYCRPVWAVELQKQIDRVIETAITETGETPTLSEIADKLNVQEGGILEAQRAGWVPLDELNVHKIRHIHYRNFELPIEDKIALYQVLEMLSDLQRKVIYLLFFRDMTQTEAADQLGISQRKVSRILQKSLAEIAKRMSVG